MTSIIQRIIMVVMLLGAFVTARAAETADSTVSKFTAEYAFINMPAKTLDILTSNMRRDMIDYYILADTIREIPNTMQGLSHLVRPMTDDYLKVQITPVSTLTIRILPYKGKKIAVSVYTVGDTLRAADSEVRFYDRFMQEMDRNKLIDLVSTSDFLDTHGLSSDERKDLIDMVPFPTIEYTFSPDSDTLRARLTAGEFLGNETLENLSPYLHREREFRWDGKKYRLVKAY